MLYCKDSTYRYSTYHVRGTEGEGGGRRFQLPIDPTRIIGFISLDMDDRWRKGKQRTTSMYKFFLEGAWGQTSLFRIDDFHPGQQMCHGSSRSVVISLPTLG